MYTYVVRSAFAEEKQEKLIHDEMCRFEERQRCLLDARDEALTTKINQATDSKIGAHAQAKLPIGPSLYGHVL